MKANALDLSHYQGYRSVSDFKQMKKQGIKAIIFKLTQGSEDGSHWIDSTVEHNSANALKAGLIIHVYHYFLGVSHNDSIAETKWCLKNLYRAKGFSKSHSYIFMDFEDPSYKRYSKAQTTDFAKAFCDTIHSTGYHVAIYSYVGFANAHIGNTGYSFAWKAGYPAKPNLKHPTVGKCDIWQFASDYKVSGISGKFDADYAYNKKYISINKAKKATKKAAKKAQPTLIEWMKQHHMDSSYKNRAKLAKKYGIKRYIGTKSQNTKLYAILKNPPKPKAKAPTRITLHANYYAYITADDAINKRHSRSKGIVKAGSYYVFNRNGSAVNVTSQQGQAGAWVHPS